MNTKSCFPRIVRKYKQLLIYGLVFAISVIMFSQPMAIAYGQWLSVVSVNPTGDIAVALGGGDRLETAIQLFLSNRVKAVYYDTGDLANQLDQKIIENILRKYNLGKHQIYWGGMVKNTFDEALAFKRVIASIKFPILQIVIVSDRYHLRRSLWTFRQVLGENIIIHTFATPSSSANSDPHWWKHKVSRDWVMSETQKLLFYKLYYGLTGSKIPFFPRDI